MKLRNSDKLTQRCYLLSPPKVMKGAIIHEPYEEFNLTQKEVVRVIKCPQDHIHIELDENQVNLK